MLRHIDSKDVPLAMVAQPWRVQGHFVGAAIDTSPPKPGITALDVGLLFFVVAAGIGTAYVYAKYPA